MASENNPHLMIFCYFINFNLVYPKFKLKFLSGGLQVFYLCYLIHLNLVYSKLWLIFLSGGFKEPKLGAVLTVQFL